MPLSIGTRVGPYQITGPLGSGGMGEVYRARDSRLNRDVAIKTLPAEYFDDANRMARLQREAQVLASLSHPNIASIYGLEEDHGVRALVMELVEGPTLAQRIAAGPIPLDEALDIARQIGDALEAAHEKGIIHRDLKPANIKLTPDGKVKVLDFGLAKAFENESASGNPENSPTLTLESTRAGMILGTAAYMSPEQARGKAVDKRADIWAFGVVLYEMLTGRMVFAGETVSDTLAAVLRADIDWTRLPAGVPPKVRRLLQRCLARDLKKRLRDIGDAWMELDAPEEPSAALAARAPSGRWWLYLAAGIAIGAISGAVLGVASVLWRTPPIQPRPVVRWSYMQKDYFGLPALSRDGTRLAFAQAEGNTFHIVLRMMDQTESKLLPGGEDGIYPVFSPDGQWIAFEGQNDGKLKKIPITGGAPITLAEKALGDFDWGENNEIAFRAATGLMKVSAAGGQAQALTTIDSKKGETRHHDPHYLPGGQTLVFTLDAGASQQVVALDPKKPVYHTLLEGAHNARYTPAGYLVFVRGSTLFAAPFNPRRMELTGPEAPAIENVATFFLEDIGEYSFSDSGLLVYMKGSTQSGKTILSWSDRMGAKERFSQAEWWGTGRLSPDGRRVANAIFAKQQTESDIWIFDIDRRIKTRLTFEGFDQDPVWTPDGRRVTFGAMIAGKHGIYSAPMDGSGKAELFLPTERAVRPTSWSPDGKSLVYRMAGSLWVLPVENGSAAGQPHRLHDTAFSEDDGQVSPDGRWLAYSSAESGAPEIYVQAFPAPGSKVRISTDGGSFPRWSKNGRELFYRYGVEVMSVDVEAKPQFRAGIPKQLFRQLGGTTWDAAPDGKRFLVEESPDLEPGARSMEGVVDWPEELRRRVPAGK
jgi:eukaryotic-like serine/threonine-protein kinase